ncbi:MAG: J domain-containing protein [Bacteroidia bacterium]
MLDTDGYLLLEISATATTEEIKTAFRRKAMLLHPDVNTADNSDEAFRHLKAIQEILLDPVKRLQHDKKFGYAQKPPDKYTNAKQTISASERARAEHVVAGWNNDSSHVFAAWQDRQEQEKRRFRRVRNTIIGFGVALVVFWLCWFAANA